MSDFPDDLFSGRQVEDRPGVIYDVDKTKVFYAKDHNDLINEIEAIEEFIGTKGRRIFSSRDQLITIADSDKIGIQDESDTKELKYTLWSNIKSVLKTYFDTLYCSIAQYGWVYVSASATYVSSTSFYLAGDWSDKLQKGDKFKLTNSTLKYFYVFGVSAYDSGNDRTTITITGGTDYALANTDISAVYYSKVENPQGFPAPFTVASNVSMLMVGQRVTLTGWGYIAGNSSTEGVTQSVSFGITFEDPPFVITSSLAQTSGGATPDSIDDFNGRKTKAATQGYLITTTGFYIEVAIISSISNSGEKYGYCWTAQGRV